MRKSVFWATALMSLMAVFVVSYTAGIYIQPPQENAVLDEDGGLPNQGPEVVQTPQNKATTTPPVQNNPTPPPTAPADPPPSQGITASQLAAHSSINDCWMAIDGNVYDASGYASRHPGGKSNITNYCGKDATRQFNGVGAHQKTNVKNLLADFFIGNVAR